MAAQKQHGAVCCVSHATAVLQKSSGKSRLIENTRVLCLIGNTITLVKGAGVIKN